MNNNILTKIVIACLCCCTMLVAKTHIDNQVDPSVQAKIELEQQREDAIQQQIADQKAAKMAAKGEPTLIKSIELSSDVIDAEKVGDNKVKVHPDQEKIDYYNNLKLNPSNQDPYDDSRDCGDADAGATDAYGDGCAGYTTYPSWCGGYDDDDFDSMAMCCACGGGADDGLGDLYCPDGDGSAYSWAYTGAYSSEVSWDLVAADGTVSAAGDGGFGSFCLADGDYTANMHDSYGDGWDGSVSFYDANGDLAVNIAFAACASWQGCYEGSEATADVTFGGAPPVPGCTDASAENYNADADADDGSCTWNGGCSSSSYTMCDDGSGWSGGCVPTSYFCDGWVGNGSGNYTNPDCADGSDEDADCCGIGDNNYTEAVCVDDCNGDVLGGAVEDCAGACGGSASLDDCGVCDGDGSSCSCDDLTISMTDSWGDSWNGNVLTIGTWSGANDGSTGTDAQIATACVDLTVANDVTCGGGSYMGEVSWSIADAAGTVLLAGGAPYEGCIGTDCAPVVDACADCEFDFTPYGAECCDAALDAFGLDCATLEANYSWDCAGCACTADECTADADCAEGQTCEGYSCVDPPAACEDTECTLTMNDTFGDGWNGATWSSGDQSAGLASGATGTASLCFDTSAANSYTSGGGSWDSEISWTLECSDGTTASGFAPESGCFGNCAAGGCMDETACNYDLGATFDDGSCYGADCDGVCDSGAAVDACGECNGDGSACAGCASANYYADSYCDSSNNTAECNYDGGDCCPGDCLDPGVNDPNDYYDCATNGGDCLDCADPGSADNAEGGECFDMVTGCTDETADNYNPDANTDDGSCLWGGCAAGQALGCSEQDIADGDCGPEGWIGDNICDGYSEPYGVNNCCYDLDGGDCTEAECAAPAAWDASITGLTAEDSFYDYYGYSYPAITWDWDDLSDGDDPPETCEDQGLVTCGDGTCAATAGDCPAATCADGSAPLVDCIGTEFCDEDCANASYDGCVTGESNWTNDSYCDDGSYGLEFACEEFGCDDCACGPDYSSNDDGCNAACAAPDTAECAASFNISWGMDFDDDGLTDECYDDGYGNTSGYLLFGWEGGCLATAVAGAGYDQDGECDSATGIGCDFAAGDPEDFSAYGFNSGFYWYGHESNYTDYWTITFTDVSASSEGTTGDCESAPTTECAEGQFDCLGDGSECFPGSYLCDGSSEFCNASWGADCSNGADEGLDICDYVDECEEEPVSNCADGTPEGSGDCDCHADCPADQYCYGVEGSYGYCWAADECCSYDDAIDGECPGGCDGRLASNDNDVPSLSTDKNTNRKLRSKAIYAHKFSQVETPVDKVLNNHSSTVMLNIATGEFTYSDDAASNANREVSYIVNISCDDCVGGYPYENSFSSAVSELQLYGGDIGAVVCANVVGVSTVLGNTAASEDVCEDGGFDCEFFDCSGQEACGFESWIGDGWCDDGTYGMYFDCDEFNCDEGDCDCAPPCTPGDVNADGSIDILDIVSTVNYILEGDDDFDFPVDCADITGDGIINVLDIVATVNIILGGRTVDATEAGLIKAGNALNLNADGYIGGVQMTLSHGADFSIELTDKAMVADYRTNGNETTLIIVAPEGDELFIADGEYDIVEMIVANSAGPMDISVMPSSFVLSQAYPNPFNPSTSINLSIPEAGHVSVMVYNVMGQLVSTLADGYMDASDYSFTWDASEISSGVYLITATTANHTSTQKIMFLK